MVHLLINMYVGLKKQKPMYGYGVINNIHINQVLGIENGQLDEEIRSCIDILNQPYIDSSGIGDFVEVVSPGFSSVSDFIKIIGSSDTGDDYGSIAQMRNNLLSRAGCLKKLNLNDDEVLFLMYMLYNRNNPDIDINISTMIKTNDHVNDVFIYTVLKVLMPQ